MTITVEIINENQFGNTEQPVNTEQPIDTEQPVDNKQPLSFVGVRFSTGYNDGDGAFVRQCNVDGLYNINNKSLAVGINGHIGGEYPIIKKGCHRWFTKFGVGLVGKAACKCEVLTKGPNHQASIYGGGSAYAVLRDANYEFKVGIDAGYEKKGSIFFDSETKKANIQKGLGEGEFKCGPTANFTIFIPKTQGKRDQVLAGVGVKLGGAYDLINKEGYLNAGIVISY